jgi:hypothetical protein
MQHRSGGAAAEAVNRRRRAAKKDDEEVEEGATAAALAAESFMAGFICFSTSSSLLLCLRRCLRVGKAQRETTGGKRRGEEQRWVKKGEQSTRFCERLKVFFYLHF